MRGEGNARVIYLACPYTHPSVLVRAQRFETATRVAADLIRQGLIVFSPITMTHPIDMILAGSDNTLGSDFWVRYDEAFMAMCTEIAIVRLDDWAESAGVIREKSFFEKRGKPVWFIDP